MTVRQMGPLSDLAKLKASQLKRLAFLTGLTSSGTKSELEASLQEHITSFRPRNAPMNIVSVDMGLRNLAFCAIELPPSDPLPPSPELLLQHSSPTLLLPPSSTSTFIKVLTWRRADLLSSSLHTSSADTPLTPPAVSAAKIPPSKTAFHPSTLSALAHQLCTAHFLNPALPTPSTLLIERQRFRTRGGFGGGAVAEWTLRVNMFEAMLWSCLTTLRLGRGGSSGEFGGDVHGWNGVVKGISPDRMVAYWATLVKAVGGEDADEIDAKRERVTGRSRARQKIALSDGELAGESEDVLKGKMKKTKTAKLTLEKRERIAIVRGWVEGAGSRFGDVELEFEGQAAETAEVFRSKRSRTADGGKLDDLADCLLQAVAWTRWEGARNALRQWFIRDLDS